LGREFLDHAIDAMVAGIYAGDPERLSVRQAFPKLAALEDKYGSLIKGQILGARDRRKRGEVAKDRAPKFSFDEGLQVLPDRLGELLGDSVLLNTSVLSVKRGTEGWSVESFSRGERKISGHSALIYAGTAHRLAGLSVELQGSKHLDLTPFSEIRYPPVTSVVLGYRREEVAHPCQGFGALIPKIEGFGILGTIFSSSLFPNRAPADHLTLTSYVGGERHPELASLSEEQLVDLTHRDLTRLLGIKGKPTFQSIACYPQAIPQYNIGYGRYRELMTEIETRTQTLFFAGHYRDGISLGDSIVSGFKVVDRVVKMLDSVHALRP
jgi:oxygen-dependent protoporphyrinogen oxidase